MALYHFSVKQVSRGKGQTVVNSAAYISGQKLYNDYYGQTHDYTKKSGVVFTEILTPEYAPERLSDRETLWNEVEQIEKSKRAQLAYSFDIALQNELTLDENIELAREFCMVLFVNLSAPDVFFFMQVKRRYRTKQSDIFFSRLFYPVPSCIISYVTIK